MPARSHQRNRCHDCATQAKCPLARMSPALSAQVQPLVAERSHARRAVLQRQGEAVDVLRVIKSGSVLFYRQTEAGASLAVAVAPPGHLLGSSTLAESPGMLTIVALTDVRTCEIEVPPLRRLGLLDDPELRRLVGEGVFSALGILADWSRVTRLPGVRARLACALLTLGEQQKSERVRLPGQAVLAEILGVTRESVVRALSTLEQEHCITRLGRTYCELQLPRLRVLAGVTAGPEAPSLT